MTTEPASRLARTPNRRIRLAGTALVMPQKNPNSVKPKPALVQLHPISATMAGSARPREEKVAAVMTKNNALVRASVVQARKPVLLPAPETLSGLPGCALFQTENRPAPSASGRAL